MMLFDSELVSLSLWVLKWIFLPYCFLVIVLNILTGPTRSWRTEGWDERRKAERQEEIERAYANRCERDKEQANEVEQRFKAWDAEYERSRQESLKRDWDNRTIP